MLQFAHPAYLWGLLAIALPILVHLFNQRRPRPLAFGAIEFVLRSQRQKARRLRLRQILLLALRCLLIAAVALALARPSLKPRGVEAAQTSGPQATALVLDASLSMRYRIGTRTLFEKARAEALSALERLGPDEPAAVGLCAGPAGLTGGGMGAPSFDRLAARRLLQSAQPTYLASDLTGCLAAAAKALGESPVAGKRIIAFSDLAAHSIRLDAPPPLVPPAANAPPGSPGIRPNVVLVDAARASDLPNAAVVATAVRPSASLGPRGYEVVATIANSGAQMVSGLQVSLKVGPNTVAKGFVDVPARGTAKKTLGAVLPAGVVGGRVELARNEAQGLDEDDGQDFVVHVPRDVKALIVDGAAANAPLEGYDVILLLNVAAPPKSFSEKLRQAAVQRGAGIFIALGDHVDPDAYNDSLGDLLPRPLHLIKTAAEPAAQGTEERAARFCGGEWAHPRVRVFGPAAGEGRASARTCWYAPLKPEGQAHTLASYDDGAPALIEKPVGRGRVLLYTSTASRSWTDWPIRVSFLPVLQQTVSWLADALEQRQPLPALVGEERTLSPAAGGRVEKVLGPDGQEVQLRRETAHPDDAVVPLAAPGPYRALVAPRGVEPREEPTLTFVAGLDPKESDLRRVDEAELKAQLGGAESAQVAASSAAAQGAHGTPLWSGLLLLGALALLGEGALTRK